MNELSPEARATLSEGLSSDGPSERERERVKARLLALMGGGTLALGATSAATAAPAVAAGSVVAKGLGVGTLLLWFGAGAALGVGTSGAVAVMEQHAPSTATSASAAARTVALPSRPASAPSSASAAPLPTNSALDAAPVTAPSRAAERSEPVEARSSSRAVTAAGADSASNPEPPAVVSTLSEEATLLERAQRALAAGAPSAALATLAEHERRFPHGTLAEEREAAKVLALCALGRVDEARSLARAFVSASPRSVLVPRLEHSCATTH